ncbi:MAG: glycoside hydrolase family 78 protein [Bacteroidia bacterium]|nr:glycoside hydrolase family 78 protein [Bacteroidia bacterium]
MKPLQLLTLFLLLAAHAAQAQLTVSQLRCEHLENPVGLDAPAPYLSWQLTAARRNTLQTAYEIRVAGSPEALLKGRKLLWASGKVNSPVSAGVPYGGPALESGQRCFWQVRVWDSHGQVSPWSEPARWQMALLNPQDWKAVWIQPGYAEPAGRPSPMFRTEFQLAKPVRSATLYVTARGLYEAQLNGTRAGDAYLTPGWTAYQHRLAYQTYEVASLLRKGPNAIGVMLGNGWHRGYVGFQDKNDNYGSDISLLLQLEITFTDGSKQLVLSGPGWKSATGEILGSELYNGETQDARLIRQGWSLPGYNDADWSGVQTASFPGQLLVASSNEPIRKQETFAPLRIFKTPAGEQVIDFGQNLVGWVVMQAQGKAGDRITLSHAEVLDKAGNFYTENLRAAKSQDVFILSGSGTETFEPKFTFHGFRYVKVEGYPGELKPESFQAVALYSDMRPTGSFECSNPLLNQLQHNIQWGQKGNFLDVPTDCPQRDERLGWTGDAQVFAATAAYNMDVYAFFAKWLRDLAADQRADGAVPFVVPNVLGTNAMASAGWADAATIIPWNIYVAFGDARMLEQQYASMKAWVEYMRSKSTNHLWNTGFHFGDWLFYRPADDNDGRAAVTDKYLIAQCFYAYSTQLLIKTAAVLGKTGEAEAYSKLLEDIRAAFLREYVTPSGRLVSGTQTAYVLALQFDMLPEDLRAQAAARLADNIRSYSTHLTTGFLGTPYLCHVLTRFGYADLAYELLLQDSYPSWLYPVKMGATTIWERWDGQKPDSSFQTPGMNSFNHYAYGAIGEWMYRAVAGISPDEAEPGYRRIRIRPLPGGKLSYAGGELLSPYGKIRSKWSAEGGRYRLEVEIPANTQASIWIPAPEGAAVLESGLPVGGVRELAVKGREDQALRVDAGSGTYVFTW